MLYRLATILIIFAYSSVFAQQNLPQSLFPDQEKYDLDALLTNDSEIQFSTAQVTNTLSLSEAIDLALENNLELAQSYRDFTQAQASHTGSIQDFWVPNLSTSLGATLSDGDQNLGGPGWTAAFTLPTLSLSKTVFNGLGTLYAHRVAKENYLSAKNLYENKKREIVFQVTSRYYEQMLQTEQVLVAIDRLKQLQSQLAQAQANFNSGRVSDLDVALSQSQFYAAQPAYYTAEKNRLFAQEDFYRYIGLTPEPNTYLELQGTLFDVTNVQFSEFDSDESLNFILTNDSTLSQLRTAHSNAINQKGIQNATRMPKVDVNFNYTYTYGAKLTNFNLATDSSQYSLGATLRIPILEWIPGTGAASKVKAANENIKKAEVSLLNAEEQKLVELKRTFLNIRELSQTVISLQSAEERARTAFQIAQAQYRNGRISLIELDRAQVDLTDARSNLLNAVYQEFRAKLQLQASINTLPMFLDEVTKIKSNNK